MGHNRNTRWAQPKPTAHKEHLPSHLTQPIHPSALPLPSRMTPPCRSNDEHTMSPWIGLLPQLKWSPTDTPSRPPPPQLSKARYTPAVALETVCELRQPQRQRWDRCGRRKVNRATWWFVSPSLLVPPSHFWARHQGLPQRASHRLGYPRHQKKLTNSLLRPPNFVTKSAHHKTVLRSSKKPIWGFIVIT